MGGFY